MCAAPELLLPEGRSVVYVLKPDSAVPWQDLQGLAALSVQMKMGACAYCLLH